MLKRQESNLTRRRAAAVATTTASSKNQSNEKTSATLIRSNGVQTTTYEPTSRFPSYSRQLFADVSISNKKQKQTKLFY